MPLRRWFAIALVLLVAASTVLAKERVWTSADGRTMRGEFVRELDGEATFLVAGKLVTIALDRLTEADQQKVRDLAAGKEIPDDPVPAATAPAEGAPAENTTEPEPAAPAETVENSADKEPADKESDQATPGSVPSLTKKPRTAPTQRVWTDNQGRQSTARFVRVFGSKVVLSRGNKPITVDFFDLSAADQAYIRDLLISRGEEELIPPEPLAESVTGEDENSGPSTPAPAADTGDGTVPPVGPGTGIGPGGRGPGSRIRGPGSGRIGGPGAGPRGPGMSGAPGMPGAPGMSGAPGFGPGFGPGSMGPGPRLGPEAPLGNGPVPLTDSSGLSSAPVATSIPTYTPPPIAYQPPSAPSLPSYTRVPLCSSCRNQVSEEQAKGTTCPHCGARWQFNQYASAAGTSGGSKSGAGVLPMSSAEAEKTVQSVILIGAILGAVVVLVGGIIIAALAIASASRPRKQPYRPYH